MRPALAALLFSWFLVGMSIAAPPEPVSSAPPRTPAEERKAFHLPEGFDIELVAAEPEIHKPLNIAFDDLGRLWVTETLEYPFPAAAGTTPRDGVKILSNFGPDGRAKTISTYADGLNIPIGVLPLPAGQGAIVHSIPYVWKLSEPGPDGRATKKEPLYQSYGFRDTHGMTNAFTWGFDGWIYACHGFSNESTVKGKDGRAIKMQSGNVYRMRPDGSHLEYVTHGQVNPFGLAFDPLGNLYSCDCHSRPIYQLLRGAWYPGFGAPHDGLGYGPEMTRHDHGSTAISGIVDYAADHFPRAYRDTIFIGNVVTNRINHDRVEWHGSTPRAIEQPDFLVSDDPWFRPVDLELGPDGALYVADFYNRIIGHYEVPLTHPGRDRDRGRIWRIVYRGKDGKGKPASIAGYAPTPMVRSGQPDRRWVDDLGDPNLSVRTLAANRCVAAGEAGNEVFDRLVRDAETPWRGQPGNTWRRVHALWILQRLDALSDETLARAATDEERALRVHAMRVMAERSSMDGSLADLARKALKDDDPLVRRAAAEALGRHPSQANFRPLLSLRESTPTDDTHLIHVVRMALRDQLLDDNAWKHLKDLGLSDHEADLVADVAPGVPSSASAGFLLDDLQRKTVPHATLVTYVHHMARHGDPTRAGDLLAFVKRQGSEAGTRLGQVDLLKAYQQGRQEAGRPLGDDAREYAQTLADALLDSKTNGDVAAGIAFAGAFRLEGSRARLSRLALGDQAPEPRRADALSALAAIDPKSANPLLIQALNGPTVPASVRERAAILLAASNRPEALTALLEALPRAPGRVQSAIASGLAARRTGAEALLDAVASGKASARLLQENRVAGPLGNAGVPNLAERLSTLLRGLPPADAKVKALIEERRARFQSARVEASAGARVFEAQCAACHQLGGKGGKVGPQLDGIGLRGLDRILEDVLDPSRNVDQAFRASTLALKDGRVVSGLLLREEGEVLVLADAQGKEVRVPRNSVEERAIAPLSPMPPNFSETITEPDFDQLVAYLLSQKPAETGAPGK